MRITYELFLAHFKVNTRNKTALFFSLLFPLIFIGIFGIAFQSSEPGNTTITIGLINNDNGIPEGITPFALNNNYTKYSEEFIDILKNITFNDNVTKVFDIKLYKSQEKDNAIFAVEKRIVKGLLIIPENFSTAVLAARKVVFSPTVPNFPWTNYPPSNFTANLTLIGDHTLVDFTITSKVIDQVLEIYYSGGVKKLLGGELKISSNITSDSYTTFDFMVPGLIIYALLNNLGTISSIAVSDVQSGQLDRLRLSKIKPYNYIFALVGSQMLMAMIQTPIMFGATMLFGFKFTVPMFISVMIFAFFINLSVSGLGIFLAAFVKNRNSAGGLSAIIGTPMAFLAGAFFTVPNPTIIPEGSILGANTFHLFDILPPTTAITALRLLMLGRYSLSDLSFEFGVTVFVALFYMIIGLFAYSKKHLKPQ